MTGSLALILRRMRAPLITLIGVYAISILGMVLIPGRAGQGLDFLHAFYFVSYTASTIGFGELPTAFSPAQRLWVSFSIYLTVIAWLYAIGSILSLLQHPLLQMAFTRERFQRRVRGLREPFFIVCGHGETGRLLVQSLARRRWAAVVLDIQAEPIYTLQLAEYGGSVPALQGDASRSENLVAAGLHHPACAGIIALTDDNGANLHIAVTSKLLRPQLRVIARADDHDVQANLESFGTDYVINPFDTFADRLAMAVESPRLHQLYEWLTGVPGTPLAAPSSPPRGTWILCGFGRFGQAVHRFLDYEGVRLTVVEANPERHHCEDFCVVGRGTEAVTLREAGVRQAAGIVAGTDQDADNLSIILTARQENPALFSVARQNRRDNRDLFLAAHLDLAMEPALTLVRSIIPKITTPLLADFLRLARHQRRRWVEALVGELAGELADTVPDIWAVVIQERTTPAAMQWLATGQALPLAYLWRDGADRDQRLPGRVLMRRTADEDRLLPTDDEGIAVGDQLLFCAPAAIQGRVRWTLTHAERLHYLATGDDRPQGWVWRWLTRRYSRPGYRGESADGADPASRHQSSSSSTQANADHGA